MEDGDNLITVMPRSGWLSLSLSDQIINVETQRGSLAFRSQIDIGHSVFIDRIAQSRSTGRWTWQAAFCISIDRETPNGLKLARSKRESASESARNRVLCNHSDT